VVVGGQWDRVETTSWRNAGTPYYPDSQYDSYGVFGEGRLSLFNEKLLLNAGVRYDYFRDEILATPGITNIKPRKENLDHVTARGGAVYKLTDALSLKGNVGTAFRAPAPWSLPPTTTHGERTTSATPTSSRKRASRTMPGSTTPGDLSRVTSHSSTRTSGKRSSATMTPRSRQALIKTPTA